MQVRIRERGIIGLYTKTAQFLCDLKINQRQITTTILRNKTNNSKSSNSHLSFPVILNIFSCPVTSLLHIFLQSWWILSKFRKNPMRWSDRCRISPYLMTSKVFNKRKRELIRLNPLTKALTPTENSKKQSDNTKRHINFDYTTVADRLRTVSWSDDSKRN